MFLYKQQTIPIQVKTIKKQRKDVKFFEQTKVQSNLSIFLTLFALFKILSAKRNSDEKYTLFIASNICLSIHPIIHGMYATSYNKYEIQCV